MLIKDLLALQQNTVVLSVCPETSTIPAVQGPYVLVLVACDHGSRFRVLPPLWCVRVFKSLARPFHKNVKYVILVQPSFLVRAIMTVVKPFLSHKAHAKIKQVRVFQQIEGVAV